MAIRITGEDEIFETQRDQLGLKIETDFLNFLEK
jgi:hypothetical protein